jgi:predicted TIM-barrel fold metal-dependent hydrolase
MITRRRFLHSASVLGVCSITDGTASPRSRHRLFDSHCHIVDHRFPIIPNQGYTPPNFTLSDYLALTKPLGVVAGAVVSGSFQGTDQSNLMEVLPKLGAGWVGVTQIPTDYPDSEIIKLNAVGVRAVRTRNGAQVEQTNCLGHSRTA